MRASPRESHAGNDRHRPATVGRFVPLQLGGDLLWLAIVFIVLAILAAVLGTGEVAGLSMSIAKWLVIIFVVLAVIAFIL